MFLSFLIYCVFLLVEKLGLSRSTKFETIFLSEETVEIVVCRLLRRSVRTDREFFVWSRSDAFLLNGSFQERRSDRCNFDGCRRQCCMDVSFVVIGMNTMSEQRRASSSTAKA